jgi:tellurite methyltransferase
MSQEDRARWDTRYASGAHVPPETPATFLLHVARLLPQRGRALDVAGGAGRHAVWLAERGLATTLVDISPVALDIAARRAADRGVSLVLLCRDLESEPLPEGPWDVILCCDYLHRPLFAQFATRLSPGGTLVVMHPTRSNLMRHDRPPPAYLLDDGELPRLVAGLDVLLYTEGWTADTRHEAHLVARRPDR